MRLAAGVIVMVLAGCAGAPTPATPEAEVEALMWGYTRAWNKHDAPAIARDFYRTGPSIEEQAANLERGFENLRAQGYHHSDIHAVKGCITGPDTAWAGMRFTRLKADGEPLPPKDRASSYDLKKFSDGWRIVKLNGADASQPLACPAG